MAKPKYRRPTKKKATKKPAKKKAAKRAPKKARSLDDAAAPTGNYIVQQSEIRQAAAVDYITDPEARTMVYWYNRADRPYSRVAPFKTFERWAREDNWSGRRLDFWDEIQDRIIDARRDQILVQRLEEIRELSEYRSYMAEYMVPLRNEDGTVQRYPEGSAFAGLPVYPLGMPRFDFFIDSFIKLDKQLMLKRGEVTVRGETVNAEGGGRALDPAAGSPSLTHDDVRVLAKQLLLQRQPELKDAEAIDIQVESADDAESEDEDEVQDGE
jgi:hypothetical protein